MNARMKALALLGAICMAPGAFAAPRIESVLVKPNPAQFAAGKPPEIEIAVSVARGRFDTGGCDARLEFGDGEGRTIDFSVAHTRTLRHVYKKGGSYTVAARGAGSTPCEGTQQAALTVAGASEPAKKAEPKKAAPQKKPEAKKAPAKKKPAARKPPVKKKPAAKKPAPKKKTEENKDEPK